MDQVQWHLVGHRGGRVRLPGTAFPSSERHRRQDTHIRCLLKNAAKRLKAAKKHGSNADVSKARSKVKQATGKAKRAKSTFRKAQSARNRASSSWATCRRG